MIDSTAVSSVHAVDPRGIMTNKIHGSTKPAGKTIGQIVGETADKPKELIAPNGEANADESPHGALTEFREGVREFTFGVLHPVSGVVGEKIYKTSISQTTENLRKNYNGALTGFYNRIHGFAFGIMRPETGVIGEKTYDSSHSLTMENLSKEHVGAAAGIRNTLREYAKTAVESTGAPVTIAESTRVFEREFQDTSAAVVSQNTQTIDTTI